MLIFAVTNISVWSVRCNCSCLNASIRAQCVPVLICHQLHFQVALVAPWKPPDPTGAGLYPWTVTGAPPLDPIIDSRSRGRHTWGQGWAHAGIISSRRNCCNDSTFPLSVVYCRPCWEWRNASRWRSAAGAVYAGIAHAGPTAEVAVLIGAGCPGWVGRRGCGGGGRQGKGWETRVKDCLMSRQWDSRLRPAALTCRRYTRLLGISEARYQRISTVSSNPYMTILFRAVNARIEWWAVVMSDSVM